MKRTVLGALCALILVMCGASQAHAQHYYQYRVTPSGGYTYSEDALGNYHLRTWSNPLPQAQFTLGYAAPVARPYNYYTPPPAAYVPQPRYYPPAYYNPDDDIICVPRRYVR
mgnify:CR=1 FL=1